MKAVVTDIFNQLHIDVTRNSTDDFNLFHDSRKWQRINGNPFSGTILLGFQLESLIEGKVAEYRRQRAEAELINKHALGFINYQFSFVNVAKPGQIIEVDIKESQLKTVPHPILSNRIIVKADGKLAMMGYKKESREPLYLADADFSALGDLHALPDRSFVGESGFFLKRKWISTSNAKNFLCGSLRDQALYFDELQDEVNFPEIFPCALLSSALLEKALKKRHDFERNPMVYTSHKISIDRQSLARLRSPDALHILIKPCADSAQHDFGDLTSTAMDYECYGLVAGNVLLFRALISLVPLALIANASKQLSNTGS